MTPPAAERNAAQHVPAQQGPAASPISYEKPQKAAPDKQARAAQAKAAAEQRRQQQRHVAEERKRPLPSNTAVVRHRKKVAVLTAGPGQLLLQTADGATAYAPGAARRGRLVSGRIFLTDPDGSAQKVRAYCDGERAPSEIGQTHKASGGSGGVSDAFSSLGDDPISMVIALVLVVLMVVALPIVIYVWLRNRRRRTLVARRVLQAAAISSQGQRFA
jgi:hypothetical protein